MDAADRQLQLTADWYQQPRSSAFRFNCVSGSQTEHPATLNHLSTAVTAWTVCFNLLKFGGYFMYHQAQNSESLHPVHEVISVYCMDLRTNSVSTYSDNWLADFWKQREGRASNTSTSVHKWSIYNSFCLRPLNGHIYTELNVIQIDCLHLMFVLVGTEC